MIVTRSTEICPYVWYTFKTSKPIKIWKFWKLEITQKDERHKNFIIFKDNHKFIPFVKINNTITL